MVYRSKATPTRAGPEQVPGSNPRCIQWKGIMKALVQHEESCRLADIDIPVPGPEEVLVRVRACALNRADLAMLSGTKHGSHGGPGSVLGLEWAGEVVKTGAAVTRFKEGDRVMCSGKGGFAEYAVSDSGRVNPIPRPAMTYEQAACLPVALQTMHDALVTHGRLGPGDAVLIQGASAGVGLMGLQIAKLLGAGLVAGTSTSEERRSRLAEYGADVALDSSGPDWVGELLDRTGGRGVDIVVDQLAGAVANRNMEAAKIGGRIVNVGRMAGKEFPFDFDLHALRRITYIGVTFRTRTVEEVRAINQRMVADLWPALSSGKLALPIDAVYRIEDAAAAYARMREPGRFGKIVLSV
jgi:NADPH2:quinone reductase